MGGRGSAEYVRYGEKKAEIEGLFEIERDHPLLALLNELGVTPPEDDQIILRREITATGKSVCRINGQLVTLSTLKEIGPWLVNIHGQHEHQLLMSADRHLGWLDSYADKQVAACKQEFGRLFKEYKTTKAEYKRLTQNEQQSIQRQDMLSFQLKEIVEANLQPNEDEELSKEKHRLLNSERLFKGIDDAYEALTGEQASLDWVGLALSHLETVTAYDESLTPLMQNIETAFYQLEESSRSLREYRDQLEFEPERLEAIEDRLSEIFHLQRKYGKNVEDILEYAAAIEDELDVMSNRDHLLGSLEKKLHDLEQDLSVEALELSTRRQKVAVELAAEIEDQLKDLSMQGVKFSIDVRHIEDVQGVEIQGKKCRVTDKGMDEVEFMISPNPGEPLRPVAKIASGGELSRIMLGMKAILAGLEPVGTLIFDEVDTGVSGRAAQSIAEKLVAVSKMKQVLCITHLPQTACMADAHFLISKSTSSYRNPNGS